MKYNFGPESLISRVEIVRTETGAKRAYLESAPNADKTKLGEVRSALAQHGYITVPVEVGGKPLLEIRKFTSAESLLKQLGDAGGVTGTPAQQMAIQDRVGAWQWIKNNTFKACLGMYIIGDIGYNFYTHVKLKFTNKHADPYNADERKHFKLGDFPKAKTSALVDKFDEFSGYGYTAGTFSSALSTYLRGDQSDEEVHEVAKKIRGKFDESNLNTQTVTLQAIKEEDRSFGQRIKQTFIRYPAEILNTCYGAAGFFMVLANLKSFIPNAKLKIATLEHDIAATSRLTDPTKLDLLEKHLQSTKGALQVNRQDVLLGSITLAAGLAASLTKEKPKTDDEPAPSNALAKFGRWLQEKPLRIAAGGYLISTSIHVASTVKDYMRIAVDRKTAESMIKNTDSKISELGVMKRGIANKEFGFTHGRMLFVVTNIIAEVLMAFSSKGHGEGVTSDATVETSATAIAAENIALQTPEKREELVEKFAQHLASPKVMGGSSVMIARGIRANLKSLENNPWADAPKDLPKVAANEPVYQKPAEKPAAEFAQRVAAQAAAANDDQYAVPAVG